MLPTFNTLVALTLLPLMSLVACSRASAADAKLDLSTASREEIVAAFPKVSATAIDSIVALRKKQGPCKDTADLIVALPESSFALAVMLGKGAYCSGKAATSTTSSTSGSSSSSASSRSSTSRSTTAATSSPADASFGDYSKLGTAAGWIEFIASGPSPDYAKKGRAALAVIVGADPKSTTRFSGLSIVECKAGTLTMDEVLEHSSTLGSKWGYYCEKGTVIYSIFNPTTETLFVRGSAYGTALDAFVAPGKALSGTVTMKSSCNTSSKPRYEPGKIIWPCSAPTSLLRAADVVHSEPSEFPNILKSNDLQEFRQAADKYPTGLLAEYARDRMKELEGQHYLDLEKQVTLPIALGAAPAKLIDPTPYTLTVANPTGEALTVRLVTRTDELVSGAEKSGCQARGEVSMNSAGMALIKAKVGDYSGSKCFTVNVDAGGEATLSMRTAPSAKPNIVTLWVGPQAL